MKDHTTITVKSWLFDKLSDEMRRYHFLLVCEYTDVNGLSMADHSKLRVEEVIAETEKAYKVKLDVETVNGNPRTYTAWLPKSAIIDDGEPKDDAAEAYKVVYTFETKQGVERVDELTNDGNGMSREDAEYTAARLLEQRDVCNVIKAEVKPANLRTYEELRRAVNKCDSVAKAVELERIIWASIKLSIEQADELASALSYIVRECYRGERG